MSLESQLLGYCQQQCAAGQKPVIGLNGPVGAGKSTLSRQLQQHFAEQGVRLAIASIDDAYLPFDQRVERMRGNPFGVNRVPPGSHDPAVLEQAISRWRCSAGASLELPRFDKTLREGQGDPCPPWHGEADALLLEGWLVGCKPLSTDQLNSALCSAVTAGFSDAETFWLRRCNQALVEYQGLWAQLGSLVMLWPQSWHLPRRWRFQAEARQRRRGGGWMTGSQLEGLVNASLRSLPPPLFQEPRLLAADLVRVLDARRCPVFEGSGVEAFDWLRDQASSPSSSATGYTKP
jgi:D-glycerate 3-kinase